jgi:hypothetical protein
MAETEEKGEGKGFKVADRRRFAQGSGEPIEAADKSEPAPEESASNPDSAAGEKPTAPSDNLAEINFSTFVISLSTQALMHLGEIPSPLTGKVERDFAVAKQMIDILGMLKDKSRGNLDEQEARLMEDVLYDLRMRYVEVIKQK